MTKKETVYILSLHIDEGQGALIEEQWISFDKSKLEEKQRHKEVDVLLEMGVDFDAGGFYVDDKKGVCNALGNKMEMKDFEDNAAFLHHTFNYNYRSTSSRVLYRSLDYLPYFTITKAIVTNDANDIPVSKYYPVSR
jgi:hypothetical protein